MLFSLISHELLLLLYSFYNLSIFFVIFVLIVLIMSLKTCSFLCWMFFQSSQQEAIKQKEELMKEVGCLRSELHQVRDERDHTLAQVQSLSVELENCREITGKSSKDLDSIRIKTTALEVGCIFLFLKLYVCYYDYLFFKLFICRRRALPKESKYRSCSISLLQQMKSWRLVTAEFQDL